MINYIWIDQLNSVLDFVRVKNWWQRTMARMNRKERQDKRELLSSLNQVNNSIESKHAAVNGKWIIFSERYWVHVYLTSWAWYGLNVPLPMPWIHLITQFSSKNTEIIVSMRTNYVLQNEHFFKWSASSDRLIESTNSQKCLFVLAERQINMISLCVFSQ